MQAANPSLVEGLSSFFKTGKGQYGEGDLFLGIKVLVTRSIVKECWKDVSFDDLNAIYKADRVSSLLDCRNKFSNCFQKLSYTEKNINFVEPKATISEVVHLKTF